MSKIMGKAFITVNGVRYNTLPGATLDPGGEAKEPVVGDGGVAGSQSKIEAPSVDCTIIASSEVSLTAIQAIEDATISFDTDHGRSYVITGGFCGPVPKLSKDGIKTIFYGTQCREV